MNFLAHAYLSFGESPILAGNMISDFIKGKKQFAYPKDIQMGIRLHRAIDEFTDTHPVIREMKKLFKPHYGLYAGAFVDIVCDYFLANDKNEFSSKDELLLFCKDTYKKLDTQLDLLPEEFQQIFVYMKKYDWLSNYQFEWGIQKSFDGIVRRAKYMQEGETAFKVFVENIEVLRPYYAEFFPLLKKFSFRTLSEAKSID